MSEMAQTLAMLVANVLSIIILATILVIVHKQTARMKEIERQMKLFEKAHEQKETKNG